MPISPAVWDMIIAAFFVGPGCRIPGGFISPLYASYSLHHLRRAITGTLHRCAGASTYIRPQAFLFITLTFHSHYVQIAFRCIGSTKNYMTVILMRIVLIWVDSRIPHAYDPVNLL
jgi:hypothetical protein